MVGIKGRSGRKPDLFASTTRQKKISFYVREHRTSGGKWELDPTFQWFKKRHGSHWQGVVRMFMKNDVNEWKSKHWPCKCPNVGVFGNLKHWRDMYCHKCKDYKDDRARRLYGDL